MASPDPQPILSVRDLSVAFRVDNVWRPAVEKLSFDVGARQTVAIVGESGSGKSVTALSVMRLLPPANSRVKGVIRLDGRDLLQLPEEEMRKVRGDKLSMIFQEPMTSLNPVLTIGFQIAEALMHHRGLERPAAEAEALRILERVRVPAARERLHEYPHRFSGGMRQRVMIAMALACKPKLLIADEPTTALDVTVQAQILELIKLLQAEEGMSVVFITHDMGVVAEIADRVVVMWKGQKVEEGEAARVLERPEHPYTKALLAAVPRLGSMKGEARPKPFPEPEAEADRASEDAPMSASPISAAKARPNGPTAAKEEEFDIEPVSPASRRPLLEVANLVTRFPIRSGVFGKVNARVHAVEDVSFSLRAGETLALVGESGCGKSTTGRSILRLVEPNAGRVLFEGQDVRALDPQGLRRMRRRMQMIFQDPFASLNPRKSVGAAIAEPIIVHGLASKREARDRVAELLRKVGLTPDMAGRFPHEFSGGQRQRLAIARALGLTPKLIVADEAVSALDVSVKARVVNLMMRLQAEMGLAFLFISHDIAVVERVSHRIAVMYLGEIVEIGPRAAIIENPRHPYTRKLVAAVPSPDP
ncbi:MAG: ABC transporter ATP-binding protein, partial [Hyphomicrobiales bacterium]|nr:ABC transporter ATP-binding protein [Hyphomicrobiales bacterium]